MNDHWTLTESNAGAFLGLEMHLHQHCLIHANNHRCCCCCCCRRRACVCVCVLSVWLLHHVNHKWTSGPVPYEQWDPPCPPGIPKHAQTTPTTRSFIPAAGLQLPATSASSVSAPHLLESQYLACPQPYQRAKWCQKPAVPPPAARSELSSGSANHHPSSVLEQPPDDLE